VKLSRKTSDETETVCNVAWARLMTHLLTECEGSTYAYVCNAFVVAHHFRQ
jgi:hypothetical protein